MRRALSILLFLVLADDADATTVYSRHMFSPLTWVHPLFLNPLPIKLRPFDLIMLAFLFFAPRSGKGRQVAPMRTVLFLSVATTVLWFVYGIMTGGDARAASWQNYLMLSAVLAAFTFAAHFSTPAHFVSLGKAILAAGLYRALMCWIFHFTFVTSGAIQPPPDYVTAHDDTVVWVIIIVMMIAYGLTQRKRSTSWKTAAIGVFILMAVQWNQRRLAWVSLVMALVMGFFLLPRGWARRRVVGAVRIIVPIVALYVLVGWGRPESVFRPLHAFESVSGSEDLSTLARNAENLGLVETSRTYGLVAGTGWGHGYIELTNRYSIAADMELWPYIPHNSVLGLLAYTGILGFIGYWLSIPTAVFLNARVAQLSPLPMARCVGIVAACGLVICTNQLFGDMGIFSVRTMYVLAALQAVALRLPISAGVWEGPRGELSAIDGPTPPQAAPAATVPVAGVGPDPRGS